MVSLARARGHARAHHFEHGRDPRLHATGSSAPRLLPGVPPLGNFLVQPSLEGHVGHSFSTTPGAEAYTAGGIIPASVAASQGNPLRRHRRHVDEPEPEHHCRV